MKNYIISYIVLLAALVAIPSYGQAVSEFGKKEVKVSEWVDRNFKKGKLPPFSFVYNNEHSSNFLKKWNFSARKKIDTQDGAIHNIYTWKDGKTGMNVECDLTYYPGYDAVEWVLRFTNESTSNSPAIQQVKVIDVDWRYGKDNEVTLHYANGSSASRADFNPKEKTFKAGETLEISPTDGRFSFL